LIGSPAESTRLLSTASNEFLNLSRIDIEQRDISLAGARKGTRMAVAGVKIQRFKSILFHSPRVPAQAKQNRPKRTEAEH